jgi:hypothetical protein
MAGRRALNPEIPATFNKDINNMKYLSDHARIVILEKKLQQLTHPFVAYIANSGDALGHIGQVVENTLVNPERISETLTTGALWENPIDEEIARKTEVTALKQDLQCSLNRLRNPKEIL